MKKKQIRTIIICALVLLAAVITILNINIEPVEQPSQSSLVSYSLGETKKPQAKPVEEKEETMRNDVEKETELSVEEKQEERNEEVNAETSVEGNDFPKKINKSDKTDAPVIPVDDKNTTPKPVEHFCTIEIRCDTVVDTSKLENQAVVPYVPASGVILKTYKLEFTPGESVFDVLLRATKEKNIHMEFRDDNSYSGKYIEGINYLYEMDAGPLSGWMYKVNGKFPNYGCAAYDVCDGDAIVWMYTCDLGVDVGDNSKW